MSEEEAKTKWCPHARVQCVVPPTAKEAKAAKVFGHEAPLKSQGRPANRMRIMTAPSGQIIEFSNCIGSACMAWRWARDAYGNTLEYQGETQGYCGLAGKP